MDLKEFMRLECEEMKKHKWIESEKNNKDIGKIAYVNWINKYAKLYREYIESQFGPILTNSPNPHK